MFFFASSFTGSGMDQWSVGSTKTLFGFLHGATKFATDISAWDVSSVSDFTTMLQGATSFEADLCAWGSKITNTDAFTLSAFAGSACPDQGDTDLFSNPKGPFCFACN